MYEHKHDENEEIEKKLDIFHILNGILTKTRNLVTEIKAVFSTYYGSLISHPDPLV